VQTKKPEKKSTQPMPKDKTSRQAKIQGQSLKNMFRGVCGLRGGSVNNDDDESPVHHRADHLLDLWP